MISWVKGAIVLGTGLIGAVGIGAFSYLHGFSFSEENIISKEETPIEPTTKKSYKSQTSQNSTSYFGGKYKPFLVSTIDNDDWWNNKWNESQKSKPLSGAFEDVSDVNSLKNKCKEAYSKPFFSRDNGNSNGFPSSSKFTISDVLKYCSSLGSQPKKLISSGETYREGSVAADANSNSDLVSISDGDNEEFWKAKYDEFYELDGLKRPDVYKNEHEHFTKGREQRKDIRELCKTAYSMTVLYQEQKSGVSTGGFGRNQSLISSVKQYCGFEYI